MVLSVAEAQGKSPPVSPNSACPLLTLECRRPTSLDVLKDTILAVSCAYKVSAPSAFPSLEIARDIDGLIGAVKERRMSEGGGALSGVEGADTRAISRISTKSTVRVKDWDRHAARWLTSHGSVGEYNLVER